MSEKAHLLVALRDAIGRAVEASLYAPSASNLPPPPQSTASAVNDAAASAQIWQALTPDNAAATAVCAAVERCLLSGGRDRRRGDAKHSPEKPANASPVSGDGTPGECAAWSFISMVSEAQNEAEESNKDMRRGRSFTAPDLSSPLPSSLPPTHPTPTPTAAALTGANSPYAIAKSATRVRTELGRLRCWIRAAFNSHSLFSLLSMLCQPATIPFRVATYTEEALLRDADAVTRLLGLLDSTKGLPFRLRIDDPLLDSTNDLTGKSPAAVAVQHETDVVVQRLAVAGDDSMRGRARTRTSSWEMLAPLPPIPATAASIATTGTASALQSPVGSSAPRSTALFGPMLSGLLERLLPSFTSTTSKPAVEAVDEGDTPRVNHFYVPLAAAAFDPSLATHALVDARLSVPEVFVRLQRWLDTYIEAHGETLGLGMVSPPIDRIKELVLHYNRTGKFTPLVSEPSVATVENAFLMASLLTFYCCALPNSPVPNDSWSALLGALESADPVAALRSVVNSFPLPHSSFLSEALATYAAIANCSVSEGITPDAAVDMLSDAIAPALARPPGMTAALSSLLSSTRPGSESSKASASVVVSTVLDLCSGVLARLPTSDRAHLMAVISLLLKNRDEIFTDVQAFRSRLQQQMMEAMKSLTDVHASLGISVDGSDPRHVLQLRRVWEASTDALAAATTVDTTNFTVEGSAIWRAMGFSSRSPIPDLQARASSTNQGGRTYLRSSGLLGLRVLVYLSETFNDKWSDMLARLHKQRGEVLGHEAGNSVSVEEGETAGGWYPLASAAVVTVRRLAEECYLAGVKVAPAGGRAAPSGVPTIVSESPRLPDTSESNKQGTPERATTTTSEGGSGSGTPDAPIQRRPSSRRFFSPMLVVNGLPDLWLLTRAKCINVAPDTSLDLHANLPEGFLALASLAICIMDARWTLSSGVVQDLPLIIEEAVADALKLLPTITQEVMARFPGLSAEDLPSIAAVKTPSSPLEARQPLFDVPTALSLWRTREGAALTQAAAEVVVASARARHTVSQPAILSSSSSAGGADVTPIRMSSIRSRSSTEQFEQQGGAAAGASAHEAFLLRQRRETEDLVSALSPGGSLLTMDPRVLRTLPLSSLPSPALTCDSIILSPRQAALLEAVIPRSTRGYEWVRVFSLTDHGAALETLVSRCREHTTSLVIMKDDHHAVFGAFASEPWAPPKRAGYYGNGQSFVFTFEDRSAFDAWRAEELLRDMKEEGEAIKFAHQAVDGTPVDPIIPSLEGLPTSPRPPPTDFQTTSEGDPDAFSVYKWSRRNKYFQLCGSDGIGMGGGGSFAWHLDSDLCHGHSGRSATYLSPCLAKQEHFTVVQLEIWVFRRRIHFTAPVPAALAL
jgi:hypothetical protein